MSSIKGPPNPRPRCKSRPVFKSKLASNLSDEKVLTRLKNEVVESARRWRRCAVNATKFPHSENIIDILSSSIYLLEDAVIRLDEFEAHIKR